MNGGLWTAVPGGMSDCAGTVTAIIAIEKDCNPQSGTVCSLVRRPSEQRPTPPSTPTIRLKVHRRHDAGSARSGAASARRRRGRNAAGLSARRGGFLPAWWGAAQRGGGGRRGSRRGATGFTTRRDGAHDAARRGSWRDGAGLVARRGRARGGKHNLAKSHELSNGFVTVLRV